MLCLLQILALMLLRQRGMRLTIISILEDLAEKLPPVQRNIELVRLQFAARFKHEDLMMQQITPPGFNAAEKVYLLPVNCNFSEMTCPLENIGDVWLSF
jgi:hypothetical protein